MSTYWCPLPDDPDRVLRLRRPETPNMPPVADPAVPLAGVPEPVRSRLAGSPTAFGGLSLDRPRIMGIVNVTPDSFSDGGDAFAQADAIARGRALLAAGADILDVGGESTRPGADPVPVAEEMRRVVPVIEALAADGALVSIDTRRAAVMAAAIQAGARMINDVTALTGDRRSLRVAADSGLPVILMHMLGQPQTMQRAPRYACAPLDIYDYLEARLAACERMGIPRARICVDPGIGFGKTVAHNLQCLHWIGVYRSLGCPVMLGASRKSFIGKLTGEPHAKARVPGSLAAALWAVRSGVTLLRVHDVAETVQAVTLWRSIATVVPGEANQDPE